MISPEDPGDPAAIRSVSDDFMTEIDALVALEELKRTTPIDDPAFPQIARDVEAGALALVARARDQATAADAAHEDAVAAGLELTIEDIPPDLAPAEILAQWRDAERAREQCEPGSARWTALSGRIDRLRIAYQQTYGRDR